MARDPRDESIYQHKQWLGYLQPVGLLVSPPALVDADCHLNTAVAAEWQRLATLATPQPVVGRDEPAPIIKSVRTLLTDVFGWRGEDLVTADDPRAVDLVVPLREYGESLRPTYAVPGDLKTQPPRWLMLVQELPVATPFDAIAEGDARQWKATAEARFERLLRETQVPIGLLSNGLELRLIYAPRGESPGHITFPVSVMLESAGRPVFAALVMLLRDFRVFSAPDGRRLADILAASRKYQSSVSTELSRQVLAALYELVRGFQAADAQRGGALLKEVLATDPDKVYAGQLTVLLRLVFLLYAEDRGLMSDAEVYVKHYSVTGLFEKLRADAGRYPDTMDQRLGGWARLLTLFRMVHDGAKSGPLKIPARHGYLFDPDKYPFLEGRPPDSKRQSGERINPPPLSDGVLYRVLQNLLILDGERISYRVLDVEDIGAVYEAMMGFRVEVAAGRSIAVRPKKAHGAPVTINLDTLLAESGDKRGKRFKELTDLALTPKESAAVKAADSPEALVEALGRKVEKAVTPNIVPTGSMVLQPSDERRRSGSHYTPRSLTEPIVRKALEPVLKQLGDAPRPEQILALKVCDPAMGSGAFLVEAARQLGELLVKAWHTHAALPPIPPDEDELLHAQRLVAQRCLYGVDKNPMAVSLAKLSLWLTTLAREHPFTFVDHALRCGDSLVGLTQKRIAGFGWGDNPPLPYLERVIRDRMFAARAKRDLIGRVDESAGYAECEELHADAEQSLAELRRLGDVVVSAFFAADTAKARETRRRELADLTLRVLNEGADPTPLADAANELRAGKRPIEPFHWEIEFPEVFVSSNSGFDSIVGNPPFMGGTIISTTLGMDYFEWLTTAFPPAGHLCDLVAYFFRRTFELIREGGTLGFVATNTIAQGDTREGGLREIVRHGGAIYGAVKRYRWPGLAAVVVSLIHVAKRIQPLAQLDGNSVNRISSFLFAGGVDDSPSKLRGRNDLWSVGTKIYGAGFLFEDGADDSTPLETMVAILRKHPDYAEVIRPYIGGEELNSHPTLENSRFVINLNNVAAESGLDRWPELRDIIRAKVKPIRDSLGPNPNNMPLKKRWWAFQGHRPEFYRAAQQLHRVLAQSQVSGHLAFGFQPTDRIFANTLNLFLLESFHTFALLQSQTHETWARFFGSSMKDDLRYTSSDCFETFPFPDSADSHREVENAGKVYYEFRAALMVRNNEGLTKTYNRFHDRDEQSPDILRLRELHAAMDRAVLDAYGGELAKLTVPPCRFLLDYEDDEEDEDEGGKRKKKKPWRYRWPDAFRDEVLALLLDLNKQRAEEERARSPAATAKPKRGKRTAVANEGQAELFGDGREKKY